MLDNRSTARGFPFQTQRVPFVGAFIHADWKISRRLTLNLGIRWEWESAPYDDLDTYSRYLDLSQPNAAIQKAPPVIPADLVWMEVPLTARVVEEGMTAVVIGGAGKSGSMSLAAARRAGAGRAIGVVPHQAEADLLARSGLADEVVIADARDPIALRDAVVKAGGPADVTVVCVDVPGCEGGAVLATAEGGTVIFFSMATSFAAAALGAEGLAADVTMLVGNGYVPGHAAYALDVLRDDAGVRQLFERRLK